MQNYRNFAIADIERPQPGERIRVVIVIPVLPGKSGWAYPVFTKDNETDPDEIESYELPLDPDTAPDRTLFILDVNDCNLLLPLELAWVVYDDDVGAYVPVGSQGLSRTALPVDHYAQDSMSLNGLADFVITKHGKIWEYDDPESLEDPQEKLTVEIEVVTSRNMGLGQECWIHYLAGDEDPEAAGEEKIVRPGRWRIVAKRGLAFAMAPEGGIPARVGALPGITEDEKCEIVVQAVDPVPDGANYAANDFIRLRDGIHVQNWDLEIVADQGDRLIQVEGLWEETFIVGAICNNTGDPDDIKYVDDIG